MPLATVTRGALLVCAAALALGLILGCTKTNQNANQSAGDTVQTVAGTPPAGSTAAAAAPTSAVAPDVAPSPEISGWTDNNIVAKLAAMDKRELQLGRLAESKAIIGAVREYAKMLVTDHTKGETELRSLESKATLQAQPASNDTTAKEGQGLLKQFSSMSKGTDWDSTWVQHEADDHRQDIADAKAMQNQAKDAQLKQLIGDELLVMQKHLDAAQKLLGNTPGGSAAWKNQEFRKTQPSKSPKGDD